MIRGGIASLLFPRSLAVVGASPSKPAAIANVLERRRGVGRSPEQRDALGLRCAPTVAALPEAAETALLLVGHTRVEEAFEECAAAGVRSFVIPGLGAEAGADGASDRGALAARADDIGAAVVGPNCMGIARPDGPSPWLGTVAGDVLAGSRRRWSRSRARSRRRCIACGPRVGFRVVVSCGGELVPRRRRLRRLPRRRRGNARGGRLPRDGATARRPSPQALARCADGRQARSSASRSGARLPPRGRRWRTRARSSARTAPSRPCCAVTARSRSTTSTTSSRPSRCSDGGADRAGCASRPSRSRAGSARCSPITARRPACRSSRSRRSSRRRSPRSSRTSSLPRTRSTAGRSTTSAIVYPRALELLAGSGDYDVLLAQIDLSPVSRRRRDEWCELIVRALARRRRRERSSSRP